MTTYIEALVWLSQRNFGCRETRVREKRSSDLISFERKERVWEGIENFG